MFGSVRYSQGIEDAWTKIATFVPKFIGFLIILLVGYFIAKAIAKIVDKVLERVGFDRAVERGGVKKALESSKYDASDLLSKIVFYGLFLIVLQLAFGVFGANPVSDLLKGTIAYLPKVIAAVLIIVITSAIAAAVREVVGASLGGLSYGKTIATAAATAILIVGLFAALNQLQIAPAIVNALFYAIVATISGIAIVAIGGGGISPMRERWQNVLGKYDQEKPNISQQLQSARPRVEQRSQQLKSQTDTANLCRRAQPRPASMTAARTTQQHPVPLSCRGNHASHTER